MAVSDIRPAGMPAPLASDDAPAGQEKEAVAEARSQREVMDRRDRAAPFLRQAAHTLSGIEMALWDIAGKAAGLPDATDGFIQSLERELAGSVGAASDERPHVE